MKIAILTHPLEYNYGGILQAWALQKTLMSLGHDVYVIDRHNKKERIPLFIKIPGFLKRVCLYLLGKDVSPYWNPILSHKEEAILYKNTRGFVERNIRLTDYAYTNELGPIDKKYCFDAYVVGSDQVWISKYCPESFLDFVSRNNIIKLSYAASCGKDSFLTDNTLIEKCKELAKDFKGISVREDYLVEMVKTKMGMKSLLVLDPTLLLPASSYDALYQKEEYPLPVSKKTIFVYILDRNKKIENLVNQISEYFNAEILEGNVKEQYIKSPKINIEQCQYPPVERWLYYISHSDYVITDSFHGTAFSIIYKKNFVAICNAERGAKRFSSLLGQFNLNNRLISEDCDYDKALALFNKGIDYNLIQPLINQSKDKSIRFLTDSLIPC